MEDTKTPSTLAVSMSVSSQRFGEEQENGSLEPAGLNVDVERVRT